MWDVIAGSLVDWFKDSRHISEIERLRAHGLNFTLGRDGNSFRSTGSKTIVISGVFGLSRDEIKALIERHGGKNSGSISGKTSFLLARQSVRKGKEMRTRSPDTKRRKFMELLLTEIKAKKIKQLKTYQ